MKLVKFIQRLTEHLGEQGNIEVELQDKDTTCTDQISIVAEEMEGSQNVLKIRIWPY